MYIIGEISVFWVVPKFGAWITLKFVDCPDLFTHIVHVLTIFLVWIAQIFGELSKLMYPNCIYEFFECELS